MSLIDKKKSGDFGLLVLVQLVFLEKVAILLMNITNTFINSLCLHLQLGSIKNTTNDATESAKRGRNCVVVLRKAKCKHNTSLLNFKKRYDTDIKMVFHYTFSDATLKHSWRCNDDTCIVVDCVVADNVGVNDDDGADVFVAVAHYEDTFVSVSSITFPIYW